MKRKAENATEYKNGNIHIHFTPDIIKDIQSGRNSDIEYLSWILENLDTYFIGNEFCISNYDMGALLYNGYDDLVYIIAFSDINNVLMKGRTLVLYGNKPDENDRETIASEGY